MFPPRNLSPESVKWAREVESRIEDVEVTQSRTSDALLSDNRVITAQLEQASIQASAIEAQNTAVASQNDAISAQNTAISTQNDTIASQVTAISAETTRINNQISIIDDRSVQIQNQVTELNRRSTHSETAAFISFASGSGGSYTNQSRTMTFPAPVGGTRSATVVVQADDPRGAQLLFLEIEMGGVVVFASSVSDSTSYPTGFVNTFSTAFTARVTTTSASRTVRVRMYGTNLSGGSTTIRLSNIRATVTYGELV